MEFLVPELFKLIGESPTQLSSILAILALIMAFWMNYKKVNIEEKTSYTSVQSTQIEGLLAQITTLSLELERTRSQLRDLHDQNIELMTELRKSNMRIGELEKLLDISGR